MSEEIKNRMLVERFGRYIHHRRGTEAKRGSSFTEELSNRSTGPIAEKKLDPTPRAGRRYQPPRLGNPKAITSHQAERLARWAPLIEGAARKYGVPVELICGVILQESGGNPRAVSPAGARGLMQLMPATARRFGVTNSFDPAQNIAGGTRYLRFLLDRFGGRIDLALAGYNAGEHNVEKYGNKIPPFRETQGYVPNVLGYTQTMVNIFASRASAIPPNARRV